MNYPDIVIDYSPWSVSKVDVADKCAFQFSAKYVERIPTDVPPTPEIQVGSAVHQMLEELLQDETHVKHAFNRAVHKFGLTYTEQESLRELIPAVESFLRRIDKFKRRFNVSKVLVEEKWAVTAELKPTPFFGDNVFLRGVLDLGLLTESSKLVVLDHKSGRVKGIDAHTAQCNIYEIMALAHYPGIKGAHSAIHYLKAEDEASAIQWGNYHSADFIKLELTNWLGSYLSKRTMKLEDLTSTTTGWWCKFCPYIDFCPEKST